MLTCPLPSPIPLTRWMAELNVDLSYSYAPGSKLTEIQGSGKTTLLKHILQSNTHGLKIAVIVNDMAEVNIDGAHVARLSGKEDKGNLVQMQNGIINSP